MLIRLCANIAVATCLVFPGIVTAQSTANFDYPEFSRPSEIPARFFGRLPEMRQILMSPNGKYYLSLTPSDNDFIIRVNAFEPVDGQELFYGSVPIQVLNATYWASSERIVMEVGSLGISRGQHVLNLGILAADFDGTTMETLWRGSMTKPRAISGSNIVINLLSSEPDQILINVSEDGKSYPGVYRLDIYSGALTDVADANKKVDRWFVNPSGDLLMGVGWDQNDLHVTGRPGKDFDWANWSFKNFKAPHHFKPIGVTADDRIALIARDTPNGPDAVYEFDLETGVFGKQVYQHATSNVGGMLTSPRDGRPLAYLVTTDRPEYDIVDEEFKSIYASINGALPGKINRISEISPDERYFLVYSYSDRHPGAYYRFDRQENKLMAFGLQNRKLNPDYLAPTQSLSYKASDGLAIPAYLTLPVGVDARELPFVILPHGGPNTRDEVGYDFLVQFIASRGYGVLQFDFRGSGGYGFEYEALGFREWGHRVQDDMIDAVNHLVSQGIADEERICVVGASFGGYMALVASYRDANVFKCAVAFAPVADLKMHQKRLDKDDLDWYSKLVFGGMSTASFKQANPIKNVKNVSIPILMIHGDLDRIVEVEQARRFNKVLKNFKKDIEYIELKDEGHTLWYAKTRTRLLKEVEKFLKAHIGPGTEASFE